MYNYKIGSYKPLGSAVRRSLQKLVWLGIGGLVGVLGGLYVVVGQIQSSVQPLVVAQDGGNVLPIVHARQQNDSLYFTFTASSDDDLQPASGYNVIQRTERVQP